jgi:16S rRNA (uracil1498-N3)-methyltransferase
LFVHEALAVDQEFLLSEKPAHYLMHVMRRDVGDLLHLFNGRDGEWEGCLIAAGRSSCRVRAQTLLRPQRAEPGPWLAFAPLKKAAQDTLVAQATELGIERLLPVLTSHTSVGRVNGERLRAQVIEAAEQCGRLAIPNVTEPLSLPALLAEWPIDRSLLFADERGGGSPMAEAAKRDRRAAAGVLIGPEGGFAAEEAALILAHPSASAVDLGPRILRAETAAVAALACWQALRGDWRPQQPSGSQHVRPKR